MWPDFQQQQCVFPSPCILLMLFKAISPIGNENITPICLESASLHIGPILLALWVFRDLMIIIGWWDEKGKIICWILSNTVTSVPSELRAIDDDNMVSQSVGAEGKNEAYGVFALFVPAAWSANITQKENVGLLPKSKTLVWVWHLPPVPATLKAESGREVQRKLWNITRPHFWKQLHWAKQGKIPKQNKQWKH